MSVLISIDNYCLFILICSYHVHHMLQTNTTKLQNIFNKCCKTFRPMLQSMFNKCCKTFRPMLWYVFYFHWKLLYFLCFIYVYYYYCEMLLYIHLFKSCSPHDHMLQTKRNGAAKHVHQMLQKMNKAAKHVHQMLQKMNKTAKHVHQMLQKHGTMLQLMITKCCKTLRTMLQNMCQMLQNI